MIHKRRLALAAKQGALQARIEVQRRTLAAQTVPLSAALARGDQVFLGVDWLKHHPAAVGAAVLAVVLVKPKRAWRWAKRAFFVWRSWNSIKSVLARIH